MWIEKYLFGHIDLALVVELVGQMGMWDPGTKMGIPGLTGSLLDPFIQTKFGKLWSKTNQWPRCFYII